jgi:outer membrane receptor protein involved in Fe transport
MKIKLLFLSLLINLICFGQTKGIVSGVLTDKDSNNATLPFANAVIKGTTIGTTTDENGAYSLSLNPGNHVIEFSFLGYENVEVPVVIKAGETITINRTLGSGSYQLTDVVIKAAASREKETALLLEQKKAVEIKQSIGAQEMSRKGVSDVEEGLTKITGITKVEGRGLFIRGLEDRYNNLLINDLQAPSNSPFKKIIPLDLFPTDIVGVLNVYKTFNPNISGDFAGATVNIETAQGKNSITKVSIGTGYTTNNNSEDFLISSDANSTKGFFGMVGVDRELPAAFGTVPAGVKLTSAQSAEAFKNNTWNVDQTTSPLNTSIGFLHAEKFKFGENTFNYLISLNSDNKYTVRKGVDRTFNQGQGNYDKNFELSTYNYQTSASALVALKYKTARWSLASNTFYLRSTESKIEDQFGYNNSLTNNNTMLIRLNQFEQSNYFNNQLTGDYKISKDGNHSLKVGGSFVKTSFQQPDRKFIVGNRINQTDISTTYGGNNLNRQYLNVKGNYYVSGLLEYNWAIFETEKGKTNKLSLGYNTFRNDLSSTYRFISGRPLVGTTTTLNTNLNTIDTQISSDIANGLLNYTEETNAEYKVKMNQFVNAGYANLFWNFGESLEVNAGVRFENSDRIIKYRPISASIDDAYSKLKDQELYVLPSLNAKYSLNEKNNLRFATSKTITRPVTMEVLPITYINADGTAIIGNSNLKDSENLNVDIKYELFPNSKEMIVVGLFGKSINNPIERIFLPTSGGQTSAFQNSEKATLFGAELEFLLQLSRISETLSDFSFGFNTSVMKTKVTVDLSQNQIENSPSRKLQGASDWLINSDLKYDFEFNKTMKNSITLVYGVYGDRIFAVGTAGLDHVYEKSFSKLDLVWTSKLSKNIDAKFSADNLLNPAYQLEMGNESTVNITETSLLQKEYKRGVGLSLSLSYTF